MTDIGIDIDIDIDIAIKKKNLIPPPSQSDQWRGKGFAQPLDQHQQVWEVQIHVQL